MILKYKGSGAYPDPRFIANPGDKVEFSDTEAARKLEDEPDLWEGVTADVKRNIGKGRRNLQTNQ